MAALLGYPTIEKAQSDISSREFGQWLHYEKDHPFIDRKLDAITFLLAQLNYLTYEIHRDKKKGGKVHINDFLPPWLKSKRTLKKMDWREIKDTVKALYGSGIKETDKDTRS